MDSAVYLTIFLILLWGGILAFSYKKLLRMKFYPTLGVAVFFLLMAAVSAMVGSAPSFIQTGYMCKTNSTATMNATTCTYILTPNPTQHYLLLPFYLFLATSIVLFLALILSVAIEVIRNMS